MHFFGLLSPKIICESPTSGVSCQRLAGGNRPKRTRQGLLAGTVVKRFRSVNLAHQAVLACCLVPLLGGCGSLLYRYQSKAPFRLVPNPLSLPPAEDTFVWLQVVDVVDDYFRIRSEQPVLNRGDLISEGRLETAYRSGATFAEPWRKDSIGTFERLQSTLQSIRRRAIVTVRPVGAGYEVEVIVQKEVEETDRSQDAIADPPVRRDNTVSRRSPVANNQPVTIGWIPLGRDAALEQVILQDILGRITQPDRPRFRLRR